MRCDVVAYLWFVSGSFRIGKFAFWFFFFTCSLHLCLPACCLCCPLAVAHVVFIRKFFSFLLRHTRHTFSPSPSLSLCVCACVCVLCRFVVKIFLQAEYFLALRLISLHPSVCLSVCVLLCRVHWNANRAVLDVDIVVSIMLQVAKTKQDVFTYVSMDIFTHSPNVCTCKLSCLLRHIYILIYTSIASVCYLLSSY